MSGKLKRFKNWLVDDGLNVVVLSIITGVLAGVVVTFYNILANLGEDVSRELYTLILEHPAFIPLLFVGLACAAIVIGTVTKFVPMVRGSGIPQTEGAARGIVPFRWYVTLCTMFAASLACIFCGLPAGAEGPSVEIGACCGSAAATLLKRRQMVSRLQIAAGASAGLAVAFNAPITGIAFAMEEAFRSFSAKVFLCAAISVIFGLMTRNAIRPLLGYSVGFAFDTFDFGSYGVFSTSGLNWMFLLWAFLGAIITALIAVGFYYLMFYVKKLFKKITFFKGTGKFLIPFLLFGAFGLITAYAMGGGHAFIEDLGTHGTGEYDIETIFGLGLELSLIIIVVIRFIGCVLNMSCGVPCGVFIPMLSVGAGIGAILSILFKMWGMDAGMCDCLVIICMSVFFTTCVKAPITGIIMIFELTGQFNNLLPAVIAIATGYLISTIFHMEPIYEKSLDQYIEDEKLYEKQKSYKLTCRIMPGSEADGKAVRTIIWPTNSLVVSLITADGTSIVPDGETVLRAGDEIIIRCETNDEASLRDYMASLVGDQPEPADMYDHDHEHEHDHPHPGSTDGSAEGKDSADNADGTYSADNADGTDSAGSEDNADSNTVGNTGSADNNGT